MFTILFIATFLKFRPVGLLRFSPHARKQLIFFIGHSQEPDGGDEISVVGAPPTLALLSQYFGFGPVGFVVEKLIDLILRHHVVGGQGGLMSVLESPGERDIA